MHELSIALELVEIAQQVAQSAGACQVLRVHLKLGLMAGVEKDALVLGYHSAVRGTLLEGSQLEIETVPLRVMCHVCHQTSLLPGFQSYICPRCGSSSTEIVSGQELEITTMEIIYDAHEIT